VLLAATGGEETQIEASFCAAIRIAEGGRLVHGPLLSKYSYLVRAVVAQKGLIIILFHRISAGTCIFATHEPPDLPPRPSETWMKPDPCKARAYGSPTPPKQKGQNVLNGDFLIGRNRGPGQEETETGDGINEETTWTFYFAEDDPENFDIFLSNLRGPLTSALLTLTLTPKDPGISSDGLWIETLPVIGGQNPNLPEIQELPIDDTRTVRIELLNKLPEYSSDAILGVLFGSFPMRGRILMRYNDDAIISEAKLELTRED
jgi:hypothetical protein